MKKIVLVSIYVLYVLSSLGQEYTRKDSLRGTLTSIRTCYDVTFYDLNVVVDEKEKSIKHSENTIYFTALSDFDLFQIDLASNMEILRVEFEGRALDFNREFDAC